jgi:acyl-ACP thioesterase
MQATHWTEKYKVTSFLVNLRGQAGLYSILNFIQDVGWMHAIHMGVKLEKNQTWVFTRQKLIMNEWPKWNETVTIKTWLRAPTSELFFYRDYELFNGEKKIGECTSTFTVMDLTTRKLTTVNWRNLGAVWPETSPLQMVPQKIVIDSEMAELATFQVRNSDIDMNNHVNNTRYAQWVLDSLPIEILKGGVDLIEYEVNFLAETKIGDVVSVQKTKVDPEIDERTHIKFQGIKVADQRPAFAVQMIVK